MKVRVLIAGVVGLSAWLLLAAGPASANVLTSNVTVTSSPSTYLIDDQVTPNETITGTGTSDGTTGDFVDVNCYSGLTGVRTLLSDVRVGPDGTFAFSSPLSGIAAETCVLRAAPHGDMNSIPPGSTSPFTGPTLAIAQVANDVFIAGQNLDDLKSYDLDVPQLDGAVEYGSLGSCDILSSSAYDPVTLASAQLDDCDGGFDSANGGNPDSLTPTRSELQVDGIDAYLAGDAVGLDIGAQNIPGYPSLTYSYAIDPATGNLTLNETDEVVECSPAAGVYPPTTASCSSFVPAGVQVSLHIAQTDAGRMTTVTQSFSSTNGIAHSVDLLEDNQFFHPTADGALNFPWTGAGMQPYTTLGQVIPGLTAAGPGSFFVKGDRMAPDGSESAPQGSVTFSNPPDRVIVVSGTNNAITNSSWFDLHYSRTVPATGAVTLGFTYSTAFLASEVASDAESAAAAFEPSVTIATPGAEAATSQPRVVVSGTAADANGLSSLTVDGQAVSVGPDGAWTATVPLSQGANTITAIATNAFGNTAEAQTLATYTPAVPAPPSTSFSPPPTSFAPPPASPVPAVARFGQSHGTWRESGPAGKGKPPVGTTFSFALDRAATVRLTFISAQAGRRVNGVCAAETKRNRHRPTCRRTVTIGAVARTGHAWLNTLTFRGRLRNGRRLPVGRYTVTVIATDPATGASSSPERLTFTIVR
jgi:Glucodextranase, domain B